MSQKDVKRAQLLDMLEEDKISQQEASERIGVSTTRQVRRLSKRYRRKAWVDWSARSAVVPQTGALLWCQKIRLMRI